MELILQTLGCLIAFALFVAISILALHLKARLADRVYDKTKREILINLGCHLEARFPSGYPVGPVAKTLRKGEVP